MKTIFLMLGISFLLGCSSTITIRDCCMDDNSCLQMKLMEMGYTSGEITYVKGEGCNKVIKVRVRE